MGVNHSRSRPRPSPLAPYPSIEIFPTLLSHSASSVSLSGRILLELCRNVARDVDYVSRLREDVQFTLDLCPAYHAEWIDEVRTAASQALHLVNQYIESKISRERSLVLLRKDKSKHMSELQSEFTSVATPNKKDPDSIPSLRANLSAAHASLRSTMELMQQVALRNGDLLPSRNLPQRFTASSSGSEEQGTDLNAETVFTSETSTLG